MNTREKRLDRKRGQNLTEFAICLSVVIAALAGMQLYVQRGLQARHKDGVEFLFNKIEQEAADKNVSQLKNINRQYEIDYRDAELTETNKTKAAGGLYDTKRYSESERFGEEQAGF